jgi:hypothetical protein
VMEEGICNLLEEVEMYMREVVIYRCKEVVGNVLEVEVICRHMGEEVMVMEEEGICRHMEEEEI